VRSNALGGRWWRLALGLAVVAAIVIWDVGLPGTHSTTAGVSASKSLAPSTSASPSASPSAATTTPPSDKAVPTVADIPGVIHPKGHPEFNAAFTGTSLDKSVWDTCYPWGPEQFPWESQNGCTNYGNKEYEWYKASQDRVYGGYLHLVAQRVPTAGKSKTGAPETYICRSGMVTSYPGFTFQYGYVQIVADIPAHVGLWSALWLAAANFQWPPEMDIVESWGNNVSAASYFHPYIAGHPKRNTRGVMVPQYATGWHTFGLSWTKTQLTYLLDGKVILTVTGKHVPHQAMYLIADLADYQSAAAGDVCDGQMLIKSVKVWKP
jgi:beta-glucanase (GH16 family)